MDKVVEEYKEIFTSPTRVPLHFQVKHSIDLTLGTPLPNGPIYRCSILENAQNQEAFSGDVTERAHQASSSSCGSPIMLVQMKIKT